MSTPSNATPLAEPLRSYLLQWRGARSIFPRRHESHLLSVLRQLTAFTQSNAPLVPGLDACIVQASGLRAVRMPSIAKRSIVLWVFAVLILLPLSVASLFVFQFPYDFDSDLVTVATAIVILDAILIPVVALRYLRRRRNARLGIRTPDTKSHDEGQKRVKLREGSGGRILMVAGVTLVLGLYNAAILASATLGMSELAIGLGIFEAVLLFIVLGYGGANRMPGLRLRAQARLQGHAVPTGQVAIYMALRERLRNGQQLSEAMAEMSVFFPAQVAGQLRAAEASGNVAECLHRLGDDLVAKGHARRKAPIQRVYLVFALLLAAILCTFLMLKVVPVLREIHEEFGSELPASMKQLIGVGDFLLYNWPHVITCAALALIVYLFLTRRVPVVKRYLSRLALRLPIIGPAVRYRNAAIAAQVLQELVRAEVPLPEAMHTTARAGLVPAFADTFAHWQSQAEAGATLSECAERGGAMPRGFANLARLGEHADALPEAMGHAAAMYGALADRAENLLRTVSYPIALAPVAALVYWISVAFYETISGMSDALFYSL